MTQYTEYGSIPQAVRDVVANKVSLLDQYILMQTGQYEYSALILDAGTKSTKRVTFTRSSNYGAYTVSESDADWDWNVSNEFYCYSNVGVGAALDLPVYEGVTAHATIILACALMFAIIFKGALFKCFRRRKSGF